MSIMPKESGGRNETCSSYMCSYIFCIARSSSLSERVCQTDTWNLQPLARLARVCVRARGTRQVAGRVWIDSRVLEVNGNRRGDRIFNMLSHALSTCQRSLPSLNPSPPLPSFRQTFAQPHNYSYRLIIASPVYSRPRYPLKSPTGSARRFSLHLLHDREYLVCTLFLFIVNI